MRWLLLLLLLSLSGCVVLIRENLPPQSFFIFVPPPDIPDVNVTVDNELPPMPVVRQRSCGLFQLPTFEPLPSLANFQDAGLTQDEITDVLVQHILDMRAHENQQQQRLTEAYDLYLRRC